MVYLVMTVYIYEKREAHWDLMPHSPANANRWHIFTENHCIKMPMNLCCTVYKNCSKKKKNRSGLEKEGIKYKGKL